MKIKRKLSNFFLSIFGFIMAMVFPAAYIYTKVMQDNLDVMPNLNFSFIIWFIVAILLGIIMGVYLKWVRKIWNRKLQSISVIKESEVLPDKAPVLTRALRSIEYMYPLFILLSLLHSLTFLSQSFITLRTINVFLVIGMLSMQFVLLIRDIIDNHYKNAIRVEIMEKDELKKDKVYLKRLERGIDDQTGLVSKKNKKLLDIKQKIKEIEDNNIPLEELEPEPATEE